MRWSRHHAAELNLAQTQVVVLIAGHGAVAAQMNLIHGLDQGLVADTLDEPLGQDDDAVFSSLHLALDDRADDDVAQLIERDGGAAKLFGNYGEGRRGGLADAESEVPRGPAHADHQIPARGRAGVLGQVADDLHAELSGRFEAEGRRRTGQRQVVVDRLGDVGDAGFCPRHS